MVTDQQAAYYTPARVKFWLRNWPLLESLAESMSTSVHHLDHTEGDDRPCMPSPSRVQHGRGDAMAYVDVLADLRRAHASLRYLSLEWTVVDYQQRFGPLGMRELREMLHRDQHAVTDAYRAAVAEMAKYLE